MACPICDQKPMNCDCTETERRQFAEIAELEEQVASLRLTDDERAAILCSQGFWALENSVHADTLRLLLERLS
jgi:hypothetical protein